MEPGAARLTSAYLKHISIDCSPHVLGTSCKEQGDRIIHGPADKHRVPYGGPWPACAYAHGYTDTLPHKHNGYVNNGDPDPDCFLCTHRHT